MASRSSASDLGERAPAHEPRLPDRRVPSRSCVVCRTVRTKPELIRIVRTPDGRVEIDDSRRLAGRGAYLCRVGDCRTHAFQRGVLSRALRTPLPPALQAALEAGATTMNEGGARGQE